MDIFATCHIINDHITAKEDLKARNELIKLLDYHRSENITYSPIVNHLIRSTGLYPYLQKDSSNWQERFILEAFKVDIGGNEATLHREQSSLLKKLIEGQNIAVSAPTSFGKSFVIDAFISLRQPDNVMIIVPTIALTDETRRRLYKKFSGKYKIITTTDVVLGEKNIFIFPQERAMHYFNKLDNIDMLIIDEFYKASSKYDKERSPALLKAIIKLSTKAKQKYFLAPNIASIVSNVFTEGMAFEDKLGFNTVYLERKDLYEEIGNDLVKKEAALLKILFDHKAKSLIYAASYPQIEAVSKLLIADLPLSESALLIEFATWLSENYQSNWTLTSLIRRGAGVHNGQMHRSLSQIQVKLFEEERGIETIISTSSIIEGVNTSAENVIIWRNRKSGSNSILDSFTYKNIIGRGGRMFKHFIGKIFLLEKPPVEDHTQLDIEFPDSILGDIDENLYKNSLTNEQITKITVFKKEMYDIIGQESYERLLRENVLQSNDSEFVKSIARDMKERPEEWNGLSYLNSDNSDNWDRLLYKLINLRPGEWGDGRYSEQHPKFIAFMKILPNNWDYSIPEMLTVLDEHDIDINQFFKLERIASFNLSALASDINVLYKEIVHNGVDISHFISKVSHAFLPSVVYQLEEYGLPRMISKKLQKANVINFLNEQLTIHSALEIFKEIGLEEIISNSFLDSFDKYILKHFYEGITLEN